ncbi:MAG TPA: glycosyltransferase family 4 protein [Xanthomonadales bacterium]|nr:glycosyltransferase family 4 protein [Xanthomonadales bacterium]
MSRQVLKALLELHQKGLIGLQVQVLEGSCPQPGDDLFDVDRLPVVRWYAGSRWKFALRLLVANSDFLLLDHLGLGRLPGLVPLPLGRKYLALVHGVEIGNGTRTDYLRTARKAEMLIANSESTARKVRGRVAGFPEIRVCWPGKDVMRLGSEPTVSPFEHIGGHAMLIVGRLSAEQRHKGHDHLIEAMPLILQMVPDAQLVIAGEGNDRRRLEAKAMDLQVQDRVLFTGWVNEVQLSHLYSQCALFVMPSEGDGFGLVFLEAMSHRLPCVGLKTGAAAEIFEDQCSGILVDREDRPAMARSLSSLLLDQQGRRRLGQAGYARYQSTFQGRHYAKRLQSILLEHFRLASRDPTKKSAARLV